MENQRNKNCKLLVKSAGRGDLEKVRFLIETEKVDIYSVGKYNDTALHNAARNGHSEIVKYLINNGADIETKIDIDNPTTALFLAVSNGHTEVVRILLEKGAKTDVMFNESSILDRSISSNNPEVIDLVLNSGFDINCYNAKRGIPPLSFALALNNLNSAVFLLEKGANYKRYCLKKVLSPSLRCRIDSS